MGGGGRVPGGGGGGGGAPRGGPVSTFVSISSQAICKRRAGRRT